MNAMAGYYFACCKFVAATMHHQVCNGYSAQAYFCFLGCCCVHLATMPFLDNVYHAAQHRVDGFRAVFKEQAAENKFFESQELDVQHAQLATAMFLDPGAPPM